MSVLNEMLFNTGLSINVLILAAWNCISGLLNIFAFLKLYGLHSIVVETDKSLADPKPPILI